MPRSVTLSFELLETLVVLIRAGGEASAAMKELGINQPSLSKRLKHLQHAGAAAERPWLVRNGKTWELTDEGRRVWPAVTELVDRYDNLETFIEGEHAGTTAVRFACGQLMAAGIVREALGLYPAGAAAGRTSHLQPCAGGRRLRGSRAAHWIWRS